ncbi:glycosyltransferase [Leucobacter sp. USHLN153]|uniref:glycosyltransferase n=1 Tax=Leucobacter sp. USHLN153 TaxID=3081268 RepID=UPI003015D769
MGRKQARALRVTIASRIFAPEPAAASFMLEAIAREFARRGADVEVLTTRVPREHTVRDAPGVRVRRFPVLRDAAGYVRGYVQYLSFDVPLLFRLLFGRRADLYIVEPPPTTGAVVRLATTLLRRPYVYDAADLWSDAASQATSSRFVLRALREVERFAMRGAAAAFAISPGLVARMREIGINTPATPVGFGVDTVAFAYRGPRARDERPYFVYAGSYSEWHGADIFIDAFARFSEQRPGFRLLFYGNGSQREALDQRIAELGVEGVEFHPPVGGEELSHVLSGAVASLASLKPRQGYDYAFTTKVYSSLASGCPVVFAGEGPTVGFIEQHAGERPVGAATGYDAAAAAELMLAAARAPLGEGKRAELSTWASDAFSLARVAEHVADCAEAALDDSRSARGRSAGATSEPSAGAPEPQPASHPAPQTGPSLPQRLLGAATERLMAQRSRLPRWVVHLMEGVAKRPGQPISRLIALALGGTRAANRPAPTTVPERDVRVYIGPTNYSGQGYLWARALEAERANLGARNLAVQLPGGFGFPADRDVPLPVQNLSHSWQAAELAAARRFTHVLIEAERSLFGGLLHWDVEREVRALQLAGVSVALLSHGTDLRSPRRHRELTPWSPYGDDARLDAELQRDADRNAALIERLGLPLFVSTPDLLLDAPGASWCPVVIDPARWAAPQPAFERERPVVLHVPSSASTKGTHLIEPVMQRLQSEGIVDYRRVSGVDSAEMPARIAEADIVLDQFRLGSYGVAACEALAAGRVVVGHVLPQVREAVNAAAHESLPILEATPNSLETVIRELVADRAAARERARRGPGFVDRVHSGPFSARVLLSEWIDRAGEPRPKSSL